MWKFSTPSVLVWRRRKVFSLSHPPHTLNAVFCGTRIVVTMAKTVIPLILVAKGTSRDFNPSLPQSVIDRALARDHAAASAEYLAEFRNDLEAFVPYEVVAACVGDHTEMAPLDTPSALFRVCGPLRRFVNSFTLAISHRDDERFIIDAVRENAKPPVLTRSCCGRLRHTHPLVWHRKSHRRPICGRVPRTIPQARCSLRHQREIKVRAFTETYCHF